MTDVSALAIAAAIPKNIIRTEVCAKCKWSTMQPGNVNQRQCRRFPPTALHVPQMDRMGRIAGTMTISGYPLVKNDEWCGEFKPRVEGLS